MVACRLSGGLRAPRRASRHRRPGERPTRRSWRSGSNARPNRSPATGSSSASAAAASARSGRRGPGGLHKAIKFVFGDLDGAGDDGQRAEQELKALSRVKTVRHPYILSLERYDIIDGQLIIVMELADRNLWDRFKECRAQGLPGIPREELLATWRRRPRRST